jgi:hypothetical protein
MAQIGGVPGPCGPQGVVVVGDPVAKVATIDDSIHDAPANGAVGSERSPVIR